MNSNLPRRWVRKIGFALVWGIIVVSLFLVRLIGLLLTLLPPLIPIIVIIIGVCGYRFLPDFLDLTEIMETDTIITIGAIICLSFGGYIVTKAIDKVFIFLQHSWQDMKDWWADMKEWGDVKNLRTDMENICATIRDGDKMRDLFAPRITSSRSPRQDQDKCRERGRFQKTLCRIRESWIVISLLTLLFGVVTIQQYSSKQETAMHSGIAQSVRLIRNNLHWHWYFSPDTPDSAGEFDDTTIVPILHVLHPDDAKKPSINGTGICMGHGALEWLDLFKKAMEQCAGAGTKVELEIGGYASIAPVAVNESLAYSDTHNLSIANLRSESVAMLLSHPDTLDKLINDAVTADVCAPDGRYVETDAKCARPVDGNLYRYRCDGSDDSSSMDIRYRLWRSYADMTESKPADDGSAGDRRYDVEFLNRTTEIKVIKACPGPRSIQRQRP